MRHTEMLSIHELTYFVQSISSTTKWIKVFDDYNWALCNVHCQSDVWLYKNKAKRKISQKPMNSSSYNQTTTFTFSSSYNQTTTITFWINRSEFFELIHKNWNTPLSHCLYFITLFIQDNWSCLIPPTWILYGALQTYLNQIDNHIRYRDKSANNQNT